MQKVIVNEILRRISILGINIDTIRIWNKKELVNGIFN